MSDRYIEDYLADIDATKHSNRYDRSSSGYGAGSRSFGDSVRIGQDLDHSYLSGAGSGSSDSDGGYQSQFGKWADAFSLANKYKQGSSGYQGGWAQPFAQGSGANVTALAPGKHMYQFEPGKIAGIVHHPQKQKSGGGFLGTLGQLTGAAASAGLLGPWGAVASVGLTAADQYV